MSGHLNFTSFPHKTYPSNFVKLCKTAYAPRMNQTPPSPPKYHLVPLTMWGHSIHTLAGVAAPERLPKQPLHVRNPTHPASLLEELCCVKNIATLASLTSFHSDIDKTSRDLGSKILQNLHIYGLEFASVVQSINLGRI